ncbi:GNAT family N-acetyltransferase [Halobacillus litoralis]|uniref:GNAT family N-acetyltransferase n=1 Tax=Halobacillus litoralis TaxID=45668 RepID=UPI001CFC60E8|nr:GNAT family N-acetyltransferase [Halobacillus litoralis]
MIETKRCVLNEVNQADFNDVKNLYVNDDVRKFLGGTREEVEIQGIIDQMVNNDVDAWYWGVRKALTLEFIGIISLDPHHSGNHTEVSYQLLPEWWGKGYATEVVKEVIEYGFQQLNLKRIVAETQAANKPSCKLLERVGMTKIDQYQRFGATQSLYSKSNCPSLHS